MRFLMKQVPQAPDKWLPEYDVCMEKKPKRIPSYHAYVPPEVHEIFFGDLTMKSLFLPETADDNFTEAELNYIKNMDVHAYIRNSVIAENSPDDGIENQELQNLTVTGHDVKEYNEASLMIYNFTRKRVFSIYRGHIDHADKMYGWNLERRKIRMFRKLCLMFLHHSRFKVEIAFKQREPYRSDKRYQLGYLFNRVRRIKTEMLKIVALAREQYYYSSKFYQNLTSLIRMYERVVRMDVDIRDTTDLIKEVYDKEAPFDLMTKNEEAIPSPSRRNAKPHNVSEELKQRKKSRTFDEFMANFSINVKHAPKMHKERSKYVKT